MAARVRMRKPKVKSRLHTISIASAPGLHRFLLSCFRRKVGKLPVAQRTKDDGQPRAAGRRHVFPLGAKALAQITALINRIVTLGGPSVRCFVCTQPRAWTERDALPLGACCPFLSGLGRGEYHSTEGESSHGLH